LLGRRRALSWGTPAEPGVFELHAAGRTHVSYESRPLDTANESIEDVEQGCVTARIVFDMAADGKSLTQQAVTQASG
jgi:hypothetical protein